jgi:hypothetical protein
MLFPFQREEARGPKRKSEILNPKCRRLGVCGGFGDGAPNSNSDSARFRCSGRAELEFGAPIAGASLQCHLPTSSHSEKISSTQRTRRTPSTAEEAFPLRPSAPLASSAFNRVAGFFGCGSAALCLCSAIPQNRRVPRRFFGPRWQAQRDTAFGQPAALAKRRGATLPAAVQNALVAAPPRYAFALKVPRRLNCYGSDARRAGQQAFRISDLGSRISFGFRISDFGFYPALRPGNGCKLSIRS